jgi:hypothetical protein
MELLDSILRMLYAEKEKIEKTIEILESHQAHRRVPLKRGRKAIGEAERKQISTRMKKYWADRKRREALESTALRAAPARRRPKIADRA